MNKIIKVNFYEKIDDTLLAYPVIVSRFSDKWFFFKHKKRNIFECPGGHREINEPINVTATRELWEEMGA